MELFEQSFTTRWLMCNSFGLSLVTHQISSHRLPCVRHSLSPFYLSLFSLALFTSSLCVFLSLSLLSPPLSLAVPSPFLPPAFLAFSVICHLSLLLLLTTCALALCGCSAGLFCPLDRSAAPCATVTGPRQLFLTFPVLTMPFDRRRSLPPPLRLPLLPSRYV